jgi:hypothetical protein
MILNFKKKEICYIKIVFQGGWCLGTYFTQAISSVHYFCMLFVVYAPPFLLLLFHLESGPSNYGTHNCESWTFFPPSIQLQGMLVHEQFRHKLNYYYFPIFWKNIYYLCWNYFYNYYKIRKLQVFMIVITLQQFCISSTLFLPCNGDDDDDDDS